MSNRNGYGNIDIKSICYKLDNAINKRKELQSQQQSLWHTIELRKKNKSGEMLTLTMLIGSQTHEINQLINKLCQFRRKHRAMNIAYCYINEEIDRIENILLSRRVNLIQLRLGMKSVINAFGEISNDASSTINYIKTKEAQLEKLKKWRNIVKQYTI